MRNLCIGLFCLLSCTVLHGQNSDSIRFNPEFQKSIEIRTSPIYDLLAPEVQLVSPDFPISKDFSEYVLPDSVRSSLELSKLPAYVIMRYGLEDIYEEKVLKSFAVYEDELENLRALYKSSGPMGIGLVYYPGQHMIPGPGGGGRFSMEDILRQIFWKSDRAKRRNRKYANAYKFYNMNP